jgi:ribosomal protein L30E
MNDYKVIVAYSGDDLEKQLNAAIEDGYVMVGAHQMVSYKETSNTRAKIVFSVIVMKQ